MNRNFWREVLPGVKSIKLTPLRSGPIRHEALPDSLIARIRNVAEALAEVDDTPLEQIVEDFQRDAHPEREIEIWENIAYAYRDAVTRNPSMSFAQKKQGFEGLLQASMIVHPISATPQPGRGNRTAYEI